jgi:hypothetical protein
MRQREPVKPADKHGLVVIVPGGPGTADFLPFGAIVLSAVAIRGIATRLENERILQKRGRRWIHSTVKSILARAA